MLGLSSRPFTTRISFDLFDYFFLSIFLNTLKISKEEQGKIVFTFYLFLGKTNRFYVCIMSGLLTL